MWMSVGLEGMKGHKVIIEASVRDQVRGKEPLSAGRKATNIKNSLLYN